MLSVERYSEPYNATGGLAAEGVINQLGRPDLEPLEVLVREAVQNCWDAKRPQATSIRVEIGRRVIEGTELDACRREILVDPPPGLPLRDELHASVELVYFADFGTDGLGGPSRADHPGERRDFVDFVRNIGQPPDKDLGGGSFGYGKAAFYIASRARTILIDTLCRDEAGTIERRFMGCALGENFDLDGRPHTGRHWWGQVDDGVPEPLTGADAVHAADLLGLPPRDGEEGLGTTIVVVAPGIAPEGPAGADDTMAFIADALAWNFWPRMIDSPGAGRRTMEFKLSDGDTAVRVPNPRTHPRLRSFVEAMDRQREEPGEDEELVFDRSIESLRPAHRLGRLVVQQGPVAPADLPDRGVPQGARLTADSLHHVALMRNAELVVKYLPGPVPVTGRLGYAGVFKCAVDVDHVFRAAEPPTHDDWVYRALPKGHDRRFVKIALERIAGICREAAGYDKVLGGAAKGSEVPLGEFADAMAALMPGSSGPGARRSHAAQKPKRRRAPGRTAAHDETAGVWVDGSPGAEGAAAGSEGGGGQSSNGDGSQVPVRRLPPPQARSAGEARPAVGDDGRPVMRYPFQLRTQGNRVRMRATVEIMANDGGQVEAEAPAGVSSPEVTAWVDPTGGVHSETEIEIGPEGADGDWTVEVLLVDEAMMRLDLALEVL